MRRTIAVIVCLLAAAAVHAQMPQNFERGFAAEKMYQFGNLDHVNLFNGNLVITLPIGNSYPIGGGSSFQLMLTYNSSIWEYYEVTPISQQSMACCQPWGVPTRRSNAGLGWTLSVGRLVDPSGVPTNGASSVYESPDGNDHDLVPNTQPATNIVVTKDSNYLRWHRDTQTLDSPDGTTRTFYTDTALQPTNGYGWLHRMDDPFGNFINVEQAYDATTGLLSQWTITDNVGRAHFVYFKTFAGSSTPMFPNSGTAQTNYRTVVDRVVVETAGGTATYQFHYADNAGTADVPTAVSEGCGGGATGYPHSYNLPILRSISLPDGSSYAADYKTGTQPLESCDPGQIRSLTLPTMGKISWGYGSYLFPKTSCGDDTWMWGVYGVRSRQFSDPTKPDTNGQPLDLGTWTYTPHLQNPLTGSCTLAGSSRTYPSDQELTNTVTSPGGRTDVNHFSVYTGDVSYPGGYSGTRLSWYEYGSPQCRLHLDVSGKRAISTESFDCAAGPCPATPARSKFIRYVYDGTTLAADGKIATDAGGEPLIADDRNPRVDAERTLYEDGHYADEERSDFDGFGHYRTSTATADTADTPWKTAPRTTYIDYNPGTDAHGNIGGSYAFAPSAKWILGTYDSSSVTEGGHTAKSEACFDPTTGFLLRMRTLRSDGATAAAVPRDPADLLTVDDQLNGNVTRERYYGGDAQALDTGSLCGLSLPASPSYDLRHTYSNAVRATTQYYKPDGSPVAFKSLDRTIHLSGSVTAERDTTGLATNYTYFPWGGLKSVTPPGEFGVNYSYAPAHNDTFQHFVPAEVTATRADEKKIHFFDVLGRPFREDVLMPDGTFSMSETSYDIAGRKEFVSGFEHLVVPPPDPMAPAGTRPPDELDVHPIHNTHYAYDVFDRPIAITAPDQGVTTFSYVGVAATRKTVSVATGPSEASVTTSENYDRLGRLISLEDARGTTSSMITSYGYNVLGKLSSVVMPGEQGSQQRSFVYDNGGLLLSETHPELGATGHGTITYKEFDARGHAHRRVAGADFGAFDTRTDLDAAERPTAVTSVTPPGAMNPNPPLKLFAYDSGYDCGSGSACLGRLAATARYNYTPDLGTVTVTESFEYNGLGGRPSRRYRTAGAGTGFTGARFFSSQTYTNRGQLESITYPCRASASTCLGGDPLRTVPYQYTSGFLTAVSPWASAIAYQPNGLVDTVTHGSGTGAIREVWTPDANGMTRPASITALNSSDTALWTSGDYQFDGAGNIKGIGGATGTTYEYDLLGRLAASVGHADVIPTYLRFTYDRLGNMLSTSLSSCGTRPDNSSRCYGESTPPKSVDGTTNHFTGTAYDEAGNVTSEGLRTFTYDALGVTTGVNSIARRFRFLYTADDERLAAVELLPAGNRTTWTLRGLDNQLLRTWSDASSTGTSVTWKEDVIRRGSLLLASETSSGTRHYILDHLGSPRLVSDATGNHTQSFSPFGGGGTSDGGALQFTGHERDNAEFGDGTADLPDYMHARFYDSGAGRFLSVDPVLGTVRRPQSWNRYSYVANNPINAVDPDGRLVQLSGCKENITNDVCKGQFSLYLSTFGSQSSQAAKYLQVGQNGMLKFNGISGGAFAKQFGIMGQATNMLVANRAAVFSLSVGRSPMTDAHKGGYCDCYSGPDKSFGVDPGKTQMLAGVLVNPTETLVHETGHAIASLIPGIAFDVGQANAKSYGMKMFDGNYEGYATAFENVWRHSVLGDSNPRTGYIVAGDEYDTTDIRQLFP